MKATHVIATALLLMTGAAVGVVAQNDTAPADANESAQDPAANDSEANETAEEADEGEEEDTVTICHVPPGNPDARHTIEVGAPAWQAHESHGDHKGACQEDAEDEDEEDASEGETEESDEMEDSNETEESNDTEESNETQESNETDENESEESNETNDSDDTDEDGNESDG